MDPTTLDTYPVLRMQRLGSIIVVQPWRDNAVAGESLTCDLETGTLALTEHPPISKDFTVIYGVLGIATFEAGPAMVVITGADEVAQLRGHPLLKITATQVLADTGNRKWKSADYQFLDLLRTGVDPRKYGGELYFANGGDPTLTQQQYQSAVADGENYTATPAWKRAEPAFFWNQTLARPLLDAGMDRFVPTAFMGFVKQLTGMDFSRGEEGGGDASRQTTPTTATITLIARRSARRAGTRQWRRGADLNADVANFVESEQIISFTDTSITASFVQVRGSIPLLWSQSPNLKYKIPITIGAPGKCETTLAAHARQLTDRYGKVTAINLANQTGREGKLSAAYATAAAAVTNENPDFRLVPFDFHKQCGATNYANLEILWNQVEEDFLSRGYWFRESNGEKGIQTGVFRTNCIDTLDRTNVVQGLLARRALEHVLRRQGFLSSEETLASRFPAVEVAFRVMFADHGDEISRQYAGTGAMKSAFTRTGKRDLAGLLDDGAKSLTRYFLNNFRDGEKQDALDLVTGSYKVTPGNPAPSRSQGSPALPLLLVMALLAVAVMNGRHLAASRELIGLKGAQEVGLLLLLVMVIVRVMFKFGTSMVNTPVLRPELAKPWSVA
ncbi:hypothetical protein Ndes2526A_g02636 [Nannochloris sp. 'desiccata']